MLAIPSPEMAEAGRFKGERLRYWRELRGLSQVDLGKRIGSDGAYISKLENERIAPPEVKNWRKLSVALEIHPRDLTDEEPPKDRDVQEMLSRLLPPEDARSIMRQIRLYQEEHKRRRR